jgi:hypothetical protein
VEGRTHSSAFIIRGYKDQLNLMGPIGGDGVGKKKKELPLHLPGKFV